MARWARAARSAVNTPQNAVSRNNLNITFFMNSPWILLDGRWFGAAFTTTGTASATAA